MFLDYIKVDDVKLKEYNRETFRLINKMQTSFLKKIGKK